MAGAVSARLRRSLRAVSIPGMNLDAIMIREDPGQQESLALCLRAVAAAAEVELDYDELCGALGVSFAAVSTSAEQAPGWWLTYGRDAYLEPAVRVFCFTLRELHPADVGVDMLRANEFAQHFDASYRPLITQALQNNQPVLAWQGWPGYRSAFWGVVTSEQGGEFFGTTPWGGGELQRLERPAMQCYVVEACELTQPRRSDLWATAMRHADGFLNRVPFGTPGLSTERPAIVTGPAAHDAWESWLTEGEFGDPAHDTSWNEHRQHADFCASSRASAARFLKRMRDVAPSEQQSTVDQAIACCESYVARFEESRDEAAVRSLFASLAGREKLLEAVHAAEADERRLAMRVEQLNAAAARG